MKATSRRARVTLKTSPEPENTGRTDRSTHLRLNRRNLPHTQLCNTEVGQGLKSKAGPRGPRGLKSKAAVREKKKKSKVRDAAARKDKTFFQLRTRTPSLQSLTNKHVLQNGLLNSRKLSQKWNDKKKPDDG